MILVNLFKANGVTAMLRSLTYGKREITTTIRQLIVSSAPPSRRDVFVKSEGIRIGAVRVAEEARMSAWAAGGSCGQGRKQSSTQMPFKLESQQHEQKSRGFAGL
jgi:hypothetical protein